MELYRYNLPIALALCEAHHTGSKAVNFLSPRQRTSLWEAATHSYLCSWSLEHGARKLAAS
ncbi:MULTISPECIES: hypothetical protein [Chroococcidiopsis]|uniref:hypothetical protein n=1 Tax=Chroococcidiopsis TaxID=54298 RepID=UPI0011B211BD|nr:MULTISPECIES: hypothetical protein [Chroococcidiopsis]MBE9017969.1 hypothetical protein [Chroococcidiopsidales cyanobacterium LEGE 13417]URD48924.1 hypothetical protein M5J74_21660 [Chroococcidiopsis sp. CCNUC1]